MDWEQNYIDGNTPWDKGAPAPPLLEWMEGNPGRIAGNVLVPGSGRGLDAAVIGELDAVEEVVGIDISQSAVNLARNTVDPRLATFAVLDLFNLPALFHDRMDWVWEHTCFCAIDPALRQEYVDAVHQTLKADGHLLAVFYIDPYDEDHRPGGGPPHGSSKPEILERFVESGKFKLLDSYLPGRAYEGREGLELVALFSKA